MCPVLDAVVGPDVVGALRPEPNARPVVQPKPYFLSLLLRDLQPFTPPDPFDPLVVHTPACVVQQTGDHAIAIAPVFVSQLDDFVRQAFRNAEFLPHMVDALSTT